MKKASDFALAVVGSAEISASVVAVMEAINNVKAANQTVSMASNPPKSQRGQNKPKCKQCGNVARSRCPYESCKSCCSRNQNPCHIHVLKASSTLLDKTTSSSATPLDQQSWETFHPSTSVSRVASLRQLSNSFAQFNNLNASFRSKKPLTRKDAAAINEWRFSKLKEYKERNIEEENETFDRYMQNIELLEEVLSVKSMEDNMTFASESTACSMENDNEIMITGLKLQLRSNSMRSDSLKMRIQQSVDRGLKKLEKFAVDDDINEPIDDEPDKALERVKSCRADIFSATSDLIDKINKARSEEDLNSCLEMKSQLSSLEVGSGIIELPHNEANENEIAESDSTSVEKLDYALPELVETVEIDQETLNTVDRYLSSLEHLEEL